MMKRFGIFLSILLSIYGSVGGQESAPAEKPSQTNQAVSAWIEAASANAKSMSASRTAFLTGPYLNALFVQENPLGIVAEPLAPELAAQLQIKPQGLVLTDVSEGSLAATAGLQRFDILLKAGDSELTNPEELKSLGLNQPGASLDFLIRRAGKELVVPLRVLEATKLYLDLASNPNANSQSNTTIKRYRMGVVLASVDDMLRSHLPILKENGVLITDVKSESPAERVGIEKYDIILQINGNPVDSEEKVRNQIQETGDKEVTLKLLRRGKAIEVKLQPTVVDEPVDAVDDLSHDVVYFTVNGDWNPVTRGQAFYSVSSIATAQSELAEIKKLLKELSEKVDALQSKNAK